MTKELEKKDKGSSTADSREERSHLVGVDLVELPDEVNDARPDGTL